MLRDKQGNPTISKPIMFDGVWRVVHRVGDKKYEVFRTNDSYEAENFYTAKRKEFENDKV